MSDPACDLNNRPGAMAQSTPPTREETARILDQSKTIAVIGLSDDPAKPAYGVASYLLQQGFRILPVHPKAPTALGQKAYPSLAAIPEPVDMVYMFRGADAAPAVVEEAIAKKAKAFWMPEGVVHEAAAQRAREAGLAVVMDRCAIKEHRPKG